MSGDPDPAGGGAYDSAFTSVEELEAVLNSGTPFDLLCLDILMAGKTGMELALDVRKRNEQISILLITSSTEFLLEGYEARLIGICSSQ